jgi:Zn finger protein HypA/HybF involved in hydrogenase expression
MLTSYSVRCPHLGCNWFGSLLPSGHPEAWQGSVPSLKIVTFQCPQCQGEWNARVVGDDVQSLHQVEMAAPWA